MQIVTSRFTEAFGKNTVYRFLSSAKTNWERLACLLSERIINCLLTLGWSDGNSFFPILGRLLASSDEKNIIGTKKQADQRSLAGKRRAQAVSKAPDVMLTDKKEASIPARIVRVRNRNSKKDWIAFISTDGFQGILHWVFRNK